MWDLFEFEHRTLPAAKFAGYGLIQFDNGRLESAFGGQWTGGVNVTQGATVVLAGPGDGGGANLATFDLEGNRVKPDVYFGHGPEWRGGLWPFVDVETRTVTVPGPPLPPPAPSFDEGTGFTIFVDGATDEVARGVYGFLSPAGNVRVTNVRPNLDPNDYATAVEGAPLGWAVGTYGEIAGISEPGGIAQGMRQGPRVGLRSPTAYVLKFDTTPLGVSQEIVATVHEIGHLFGLTHIPGDGDPFNVMYPAIQGVPNTGQFNLTPTQYLQIHAAANAALTHATL